MAAAAGSLVAETGSLRGQRFLLPLPPSSLTLGRDPGCSLPFPSEADADRLMGRRHAQIDVRADGVYLIDLNSANGTLVQLPDGRMEALTSSIRLVSGMRIALGGEEGTWLSVQLVEDAAAAVHQSYAMAEPGQRRDAETVRLPRVEAAAIHQPPLAASSVPPWPVTEAAAEPVHRSLGSLDTAPDEQPARIDWLRERAPIPPAAPADRPPASRGAEIAPAGPDQELRRHRVLLLQQVAVIAALLIAGCIVGTVLGIRLPETDATSIGR